MPAEEVHHILATLRGAGLSVWIDGGWGVDACLGEQTRSHEDVDLVVELEQLDRVVAALRGLGYELAEDHRPTRAVLHAPAARQIDLHPIWFDSDGNGWQRGAAPDGSDCLYPADGFATGVIEARTVPCLAPHVQLAHHTGYAPRPRDVADVRALTERFALELPPRD
jgi:lincosamide nucleotidyltransferase A/C/D/E